MKFTVKNSDKFIEINGSNGSLLNILAENSISINAYCGGRGICKKCKVRFLKNIPAPNEIEKQSFTEQELKSGIRLACMHNAVEDSIVEVFENKPKFSNFDGDVCTDDDKNYIALDIGTTTIALSFVKNGKVAENVNFLNPQMAYGADVLSRISFSNNGKTDILINILQSSILKIIEQIKMKHNVGKIDFMIVSANPTMLAFFFSKNPTSIGKYPYKPVFYGSLYTEWNGIDTYTPPVLSAFIGSDVTSGLTKLDFNKNFLFLDIGTNCEFVLNYKNRIYSASVPAGPALEGASIDYGMTAQEGAIEKVEFDGILKCTTIGNKKAKGITGSGLISAIALLRRYNIINKRGNIVEAWEIEDAPLQLINRIKENRFLLDNNIFLTQKSIREFQLVKASLNAGIQILIDKTGLSFNEIETVYMSGGFSKNISKEDIFESNLLAFKDNVEFLGNSSLSGALQLFCKKEREKIESVSKKIEYIEIANEANFQNLYLEYMDFK